MLDLTATLRYKACCQLWYCHPWLLDPGIPFRDDSVTQTLVYNDERNAWERENTSIKWDHFEHD